MKQGFNAYKWLGLTGTFAELIILAEALSLELTTIQQIATLSQGTGQVVGCFLGFAVSLIVLYSISPYFMGTYGATVYNLSLLTASFYGLVFDVVIFQQADYDWLYFVGFGLITVGIVVYNVPGDKKPLGQDAYQELQVSTVDSLG
jgi:solute carrier family 35 protein F1/2